MGAGSRLERKPLTYPASTLRAQGWTIERLVTFGSPSRPLDQSVEPLGPIAFYAWAVFRCQDGAPEDLESGRSRAGPHALIDNLAYAETQIVLVP